MFVFVSECYMPGDQDVIMSYSWRKDNDSRHDPAYSTIVKKKLQTYDHRMTNTNIAYIKNPLALAQK